MHRFAAFVLILLPLSCQRPQPGVSPREAPGRGYRAEVEAFFTGGAAAWNRGDLDGFMEDFLDSPRTTFVGRSGILRGRAAIRAVYAPRFVEGARRDSLSFEGIEVDSLAPGVAHTVAYYVLSRGDSVVARGPTSLVMLRDAGGRWRIVHDHSS